MTFERENGPASPLEADGTDYSDPSLERGPAEIEDEGRRSLIEDIEDLFLDAKTYFDAELSYQKSRARFVGQSLANAVANAAIGAILGLVALIALSVGMILALATLVGPLAATVIVTIVLLVLVFFLFNRARSSWQDIRKAMNEEIGEDQ